MMGNRAGAALLELLVAAVLSAIVVGVAVLLLQAQTSVGRAITTRSERNDATRSAFAILRAELRHAGSSDVRAVARDSIAARIARGLAVVCGFNSPDVFVRYQGLRLPDPAKDSALQLGPENVVAIASVRADTTACARQPGDQILAVRWAAPPRVGASWLVFESGSYHISTHAVRYRQNGSPRQPITNEVFDDARSAFTAFTDTVLRAIDVSLSDRYVAATRQTRLYLSNSR